MAGGIAGRPLMPIAVHPRWLSTLPDTTRYVDVRGVTLPVVVTKTERGHLALHVASGVWGYGGTVEAAVADCGDALTQDVAWYLEQEGARMVLHGTEYEKREALRKTFGGGQ